MKEIPFYFEVKSKLNKMIRTTKTHWDLITLVKHPIIRDKELLVKRCLQDLDKIRLSKEDGFVYLYYNQWEKYYLCVVAKHLNGDGYIVTVYITNKIKEGEQVWKK